MQQQYLPRNTLIKLIHTGQRTLGLDEETYRDMLESITGMRSCGDRKMTPKKLTAVLARMRELGFDAAPQARAKPKAAPKAPLASPRQLGRVRGLWQRMHSFSIVHDVSDSAMDAYSRRMVGCHLGACTGAQCQRLIECLKQWWRRAATPQQAEALEAFLATDAAGADHVVQ